MRRIVLFITLFLILTSSVNAKLLDNSLEDIFKNIKKTFSYYGEVVAIVPQRNEAVVQFKDTAPKKGTEVVVFREGKSIINKISGRVVGSVENMIGLITIKESTGTVALGDIIKNNGIEIGDKVKFPARIVFLIKGIENLTSIPTQAYDIESYMDLAVSKYPEFQLINQNSLMHQPKDAYIVYMKIYIKDSTNPMKKKISVKVYSSYSGYTIGLFSETFKLTKKMMGYNSAPVPMNMNIKPYSGGLNSGIPVYPLGGSPAVSQAPAYPGYPSYPSYGAPAQQMANVTPEVKPYPMYGNVNMQQKEQTLKPVMQTPLKPLASSRKILSFDENIKFVSFCNDYLIYSDGKSLTVGKLKFHKFKKIASTTLNKKGKLLGLSSSISSKGKLVVLANIIDFGRMVSSVYILSDNMLKKKADNLNYILGYFDFDKNGKYSLAGQRFDKKRIYGAYLYKLEENGETISRVKKEWIPFGFRLPYYTTIKLDKKDSGMVFINNNGKLLIYRNGERVFESKKKVASVKPFNIDNKRVGFFSDKKIEEVVSDNIGNIIEQGYSSKIESDILGCSLINYEIVCVANDKGKVSLISLPLMK